MNIPKTLLQAVIAGLAIAGPLAACEKEDLRRQDEHTDECIEGCVDPEAHQAEPQEYYCPPCGRG